MFIYEFVVGGESISCDLEVALKRVVEAVNNGWPFTLSQWHENIVIAHVRWEKANAPIMFQVIGKHPVYKDLRSMNDEVLEHEIRQFLEPG